MKNKLIIILIGAVLITFLIYKFNYHNNILITSISNLDNNYNNILIEELSNNNITFNIDYSNKDLEIENLISMIYHNKNNIQNIIHDSKVLIISIGNIDIEQENIINILNEYKELFSLIRYYNKYEIVFISPYNFRYHDELRSIANKFNIKYINSSSYNNSYLLVRSIINYVNI